MSYPFSLSTGRIEASGAASVPVPCVVTGYDLVDGEPGSVTLYDSAAASGTVISHCNATGTQTVTFDVPIKCRTGVYVELDAANAIVRYA